MTLPDERYRSVKQTRDFLWKLAGGEFPRTPKIVREHAASCLRHFPSEWELEQLADASPHIMVKRMEDVQRMFMKYEEGKKNET